MTHFLDGGKTMTAHKERVMREMETHPVLSVDDREDLTLCVHTCCAQRGLRSR